MKEGPDISRIAATIGDPARANMLLALMSGKALTATELANEAGITPQTASTHLSRLGDTGLVRPTRQGRHKYFTLADDSVAQTLEALLGLAAGTGQLRTRTGPKDAALRRARVCYNHLAGEMGIQLLESLHARRLLGLENGRMTLTEAGRRFVEQSGIDLAPLEMARAPLCRECLDWSERRAHLAGSLGRAFLSHFEAQGWARRSDTSRAVTFSARGQAAFGAMFPLPA